MEEKGSRRAKVTPETRAEAVKLREIWDAKAHPGQAEFGETYGVGNQSAVSQFLRGDAPLSLKAARGFATGLGCRIEDFSPRLAAEAASIANMVPGKSLDAEVAAIAQAINSLKPKQREWVLRVVNETMKLAPSILPNDNNVTQTGSVSDTAHPPGKAKVQGRRM